MISRIKETINIIELGKKLPILEIERAKHIFNEFAHIILLQGTEKITIQVDDHDTFSEVILFIEEGMVFAKINGVVSDWNLQSLVALYVAESSVDEDTLTGGITYSRSGMQKRILEERKERARKAGYKVRLAR